MHDSQKYVLATATEMNEDGTPRYRRKGELVSRQGGKSKKTPWIAWEAALSGLHVAYTAQERAKASERWRDWAETWMNNAQPRWKGRVVYRAGSEIWTLPGRGSVRILTPKAKATRGPTLDVLIVDESAWVPAEYLDAATGTLVTRPMWQIWRYARRVRIMSRSAPASPRRGRWGWRR